MKVGDMVVRAYTWPCLLPGIIVDEDSTMIEFDGDPDGSFSYEEVSFTVAWSDSTMSMEQREELEYFEEMVDESR